MKNVSKISLSLFLALLLLLAPLSPSIMAAQEVSITPISFEIQSTDWNPTMMNYEQLMLNKAEHLHQSLTTLNMQINISLNSNTTTDSPLGFLDEQMRDLLNLQAQWELLEQTSRDLLSDNEELISLLESSGRIIASLEQRLASATRGVTDALENWWHMENLLDEQRELVAIAHLQINQWERAHFQLQRRVKLGPYVFAIGGICFVGGGSVMGMGIANNDIQQTMTGAGIVVGTGLIYILGRTFNWW